MSTPFVIEGARGQRHWVRAFLRAAVAAEYPATIIAVAMALIELHFNRKTGQCNPGYPVLAAELSCSKKTIQRAATRLEHDGWIKRYKPGRHDHVEFTFAIPRSAEDDLEETIAVLSKGGLEGTQSRLRGDNCGPPFNEEHLNTGNLDRRFRSRSGDELTQTQKAARAAARANEARGR